MFVSNVSQFRVTMAIMDKGPIVLSDKYCCSFICIDKRLPDCDIAKMHGVLFLHFSYSCVKNSVSVKVDVSVFKHYNIMGWWGRSKSYAFLTL